ncbi:protein of unknown function [Bradyrhizobium vignae]|uniref:Uncharacterized protein n=1 Tax=Bradyrhizobium vignae TaxID=1549949 RepID=A0A2U3QA12_9BRAD|nr:protein of unknown function [Bradyrhizobium vignae]
MGASVLQLGMKAEGVGLNKVEATLLSGPRVKLFYTSPGSHNSARRELSRIHMAHLPAQHGLGV